MPLVRAGSALGSTVLFLGGGRAWTVDDAILDADARGALDEAIEETLALSAAGESGIEIDDDALQESSERFRYDHELISAGETEDWLATRGMTLDDFAGWLYRRMCAEAVLGREGEPRTPSSELPATDDFPEQLHVHLWLSGEMDRLGAQFRRRIAAEMELAGEKLSRDDAWDRLTDTVLNEDARRRKLETLRHPLTRLQIDTLVLEPEAAAREACLCVRNDGDALADVAAGAGYAIKRDQIWIKDDVLPQASFAAEGELVGPIPIANGFKLCQVVRRIEPSLDDAEVAARVDAMLLDEFFEELCSRHTQLPVAVRTSQ